MVGAAESRTEPRQGVECYTRFQRDMETLHDWDMLSFDVDAANRFASLRRKFNQAATWT